MLLERANLVRSDVQNQANVGVYIINMASDGLNNKFTCKPQHDFKESICRIIFVYLEILIDL
jgi:hypothetical protein